MTALRPAPGGAPGGAAPDNGRTTVRSGQPAPTRTRPRTCGARIPVTAALKARVHAKRGSVPGMARASIVCGLGEHGIDGHWGIVRDLAAPQGGAVWATWMEGDVPYCLSQDVCPQIGRTRRRTCALFRDHPGVCSFALDVALAEDPGRAGRIETALKVLSVGESHDQQTLSDAAHDATLLTWDELRAGVWRFLPAGDQAAVYRLVSRTDSVRTMKPDAVVAHAGDVTEVTRLWSTSSPCRLPRGEIAESHLTVFEGLPTRWQAWVLGGQRLSDRDTARIPFDEALSAAVRQFDGRHMPPPARRNWEIGWDRKDDREIGARVADRLTRLPLGWRVDALRRIAAGTDAVSAVSDAAMAINIIPVYGLFLAWNRRRRPRRVRA